MRNRAPVAGSCRAALRAAAPAAAALFALLVPSNAAAQLPAPTQPPAAFQQPGFAQTPANQTGRMFDMNPQFGGDGLNYFRPMPPLLGGNAYASGNVRYGMGLRTRTTIADPTEFRGNLGSSTLSDFIRDSFSVGDVYGGRRELGAPAFYDPARTAPNVSYLRGDLPGQRRSYDNQATPGAGTTGTLPGMLNYTQPIEPRDVAGRVPTAAPPQSQAELYSAIFGLRQPPMASGVYSNPAARAVTGTSPTGGPTSPVARILAPGVGPNRLDSPIEDRRLGDPLDARVGATSPLDLVLNSDAQGILTGRTPSAPRANRPAAPPPGPIPPTEATGVTQAPADRGVPDRATPRSPAAAQRPAPRLRDASMLPGQDVFTDMRLALALQKDPGAAWFQEMQQALREDPDAARRSMEAASLESSAFVERIIATPIRSFAGPGDSALNQELAKAEALMAEGRFFDAANSYDRARLIDGTNPLPVLGRGHALLGAGDYLTAAVTLLRGLERFPEMTRFTVDLKSLMGGGETVDIRRADIMQRIEQHDDPRLRFLLGYLEYHGGDRVSGLRNLEKAAEAAEPGSMMQRYPRMLKGEVETPPPMTLPDPLPVPQSPPATPSASTDAGPPPTPDEQTP